jgi:CBS-domain-containing membrane protein
MNDQRTSRRPGRADYQQALQSMGTFIDVSADDLMLLSRRAEQYAARRVTESIRVSRIMSQRVQTVRPTTALKEAAHLMVMKRISGLPVVDERQRLVGIITEADFLRALGVPAQGPSHNLWQTLEFLFSHLAHQGEVQVPEDSVADHMMRDVITARPEQDLHDVLDLMKQHRVKRVVVCDSARQIVGIVTRSDLVRTFFDPYTGQG